MRGLTSQELDFLSMCGHGRTASRLFTTEEEQICDVLFDRGLIANCVCSYAEHGHAILTPLAALAIECQELSQ